MYVKLDANKFKSYLTIENLLFNWLYFTNLSSKVLPGVHRSMVDVDTYDKNFNNKAIRSNEVYAFDKCLIYRGVKIVGEDLQLDKLYSFCFVLTKSNKEFEETKTPAHYNLLMKISSDTILHFDPLNLTIDKDLKSQFGNDKIISNSFRVQRYETQLCFHYCCLFAMYCIKTIILNKSNLFKPNTFLFMFGLKDLVENNSEDNSEKLKRELQMLGITIF